MASTVPFNNIPGNLLVPFWYAELNSGGSPFQGQSRFLALGQKLAGGSAAAGVPIGPIQSHTEAVALFGDGSMLVAMYDIARRNAPFQPIWALPLADPAGVAASGTITFTAPGVTGAAVMIIMGRRIVFQVNAADTATTVALAAKAAINAAALPVTSNNAAGVLTVTARHVGALGNGIDLLVPTNEPNVLTAANAVIVAMASGTGVPSLTTPLANLGDDEFDFIAGPYADATSLNSLRDFFSDAAGRWSPTQQLYGHYFGVLYDTLSNCVTLGNGRNDQHVSIMASQLLPTPTWEFAAAIGAMAASHLSDAPELSRPLQHLILQDVLPPWDRSKWWDIPDRQALYADGMAAYKVTVDGQVQLDRVITTYQLTAAGAADATFRDVETMAQLMFIARYFRTAISNRHARQALVDANEFAVAELTTADDIKNTFIHAYTDLCALGVTEKPEVFAQYVTVVRDPNDANRVNAYLPADVVNQLRIVAVNITAYLQYQSPSGRIAA